MATPRRELVDLSVTPYYHCMSRCVRRAFLCGKDELTGKDFSHRRAWIRDRIKHLASIFAIDICAYAVMSNHLHVVLHADQAKAEAWTDDEVIERHVKLYPMSGTKLSPHLPRKERSELIGKWRARLFDISWFMRGLNEHIARMANKEDKIGGRFWEGRFKSQALVDERGLHRLVDVLDEERDDLFPGKLLAELLSDAVSMPFLHRENNIRPADITLGYFYPRALFGAT